MSTLRLLVLLVVIALSFDIEGAAADKSALTLPSFPTHPSGAARPDRFIVTFRNPTTQASDSRVVSTRVRQISRASHVVEVAPSDLQTAMAVYKSRPDVKAVELDYLVSASMIPNDPQYSNEWGPAKIGAPAAWDVVSGASGIKVAVLDTGMAAHADLPTPVTSSDFSGSPFGAVDHYGHGTHVAGTVAAIGNNNLGVIGIAYNASLMNGKVLGDEGWGTFDTVISGVTWATNNGAKVISMSLGAALPCSVALQDAVDYAWAHDVVIVAAAGNDGQVAVHAPANCNHVVPVGAVDSTDTTASFSNHGPGVPISAPGVLILSTTMNGDYGYLSGTSMATPHAASVAALIWASSYGTSNANVVSRLLSTADPLGSDWVNGRINAARAVGAVATPTPTLTPTVTPTLIHTATPTATPTLTPTRTPTPTLTGPCSPRPPVTTSINKTSSLTMTVTLTAASTITSVVLHPSPNAQIVAGPTIVSATQRTFSAKQTDFGSWTVQVDVTDGCGVWHTLAGYGR